MWVILFLLFAVGASQVEAQEQPFIIKSGVSNVRVDVDVRENGQPVGDLKKEDFSVYDRGVKQEILFFDHGDEPLSILLLLDVSGSMEKYVEEVAAVAQGALKHLKPRDRVGVMIFARTDKATQPFTSDFAAVETAIRESVRDRSVGSATEMNVALVDAARYLDESAEQGRRAILILTDNRGLSYRLNDDQVLQELYRDGLVVDALVVGRGERPEPPRPGSNPDFTPFNIFYIAEETGGEAVKSSAAAVEFPRMIERIRMRYGLQYRTPDTARPGMARSLRVELNPAAEARYPNAVLTYRKKYVPR
jgi:VWFA-related protein